MTPLKAQQAVIIASNQRSAELEAACGTPADCNDCVLCSVSESDGIATLSLTQIPNNQALTVRRAAVDENGAAGLLSAPVNVRTFDTLAPDAATDLIAQTGYRLITPTSATSSKAPLTTFKLFSMPILIRSSPYAPMVRLSCILRGSSRRCQRGLHLAIRAGNFTSLRLWDRDSGETLISEPRYVAGDESGWTLLQFANIETQNLGLELGITTIIDENETFSGIQVADIGLLGPPCRRIVHITF